MLGPLRTAAAEADAIDARRGTACRDHPRPDLAVLQGLKAYRQRPEARFAIGLEARFDRIFAIRTGYGDLDKLLFRLLRRNAELLRVLERPEIPLHTNASENDLRSFVIKRKISGGTMSREGRIARDTLLGLMKTCQKLRLSF
nr:transposase [Rhizobium anhuiense]